MKITAISRFNVNFKGNAPASVFPEQKGRADFVGNLALNSAADIMRDNPKTGFLMSGSWATGNNYNPNFSDHDLTVLIPDAPQYKAMESAVFEIKQTLKGNVIKRLERHKVSEDEINLKVLPSINIFPPPKVQNCFDSYKQFRDFTNLKLSLHSQIDPDKGLWQMKELLTEFFENEGWFLHLDGKGKSQNVLVRDNRQGFYDYVSAKGIYIPQRGVFYDTQKLRILDEFIQILKGSEQIPNRSFFKYLQRVQKFLFKDSQNDLFLISEDEKKVNQKKFEALLDVENKFLAQYRKIMGIFGKEGDAINPFISEKYAKGVLEELKIFSELTMEILKRPVLRGFKSI